MTKADPNAVFVTFHCRGIKEGHADEPWYFRSFYKRQLTPGGPFEWIQHASSYQTPTGAFLTKIGGTSAQFLDGDRYRAAPNGDGLDEWGEWGAGDVTRTRYALKCRKCSLEVDVRGEKLDPILDTLELAGISMLQLEHLGARLRRSQ